MNDTIAIKKPFDAHVHFRQGAMLRAVVPFTASNWSRAIVMPNTVPPIETAELAATYKKEILGAVPRGTAFEPLMTFYLTKKLTPGDIEAGTEGSTCKIFAVKSYPFGATTNSQWGFASVLEAKEVLKKMEEFGMPLLLHGEVHVDESGNEIDPHGSERLFIEDVLPRLLDAYPNLKVSLEHLSTKIGAEFIEKNGKEGRLVATVTPHHLLYSRDDAEKNVLLRCKPAIKGAADREAVRALVAKGLPFVFAGTDSAPHPESKKLSANPAFGVFSASVALELYTQVFEGLGALDKLENFLSIYGPRFYDLPTSAETITLEKKEWQLAEVVITESGEKIVPMAGTATIRWHVAR
ncbi:dihydroorotase [Candidatus Kaiserbacteria bacterium]|nr:dihydroorotase [Candidatus Kaiserbacteria bacterium]